MTGRAGDCGSSGVPRFKGELAGAELGVARAASVDSGGDIGEEVGVLIGAAVAPGVNPGRGIGVEV